MPTFRLLFRAVVLAAAIHLVPGATSPAHAQLPASIQPGDALLEIRTAAGTRIVGRIVAVTDDRLTIETGDGARIELPRATVVGISAARGRVVNGQYWAEDPNQTRLLLVSPTGRTLPRGQGYISAFYLFFPFIGYGITDDLTLAAGTPLIGGNLGNVFYVAPKYRVHQRPGLDVAVGSLNFFATEEVDEGSAGIGYLVGTTGDGDRSVSVGAGWGYALGGGVSEISSKPLILLAGEYRVGRSVKLLTENFFVPGSEGAMLSGGVRFIGERLSVDFGFFRLAGLWSNEDWDNWFPTINFVYNFGRRR
jgi:preprotein translocase subunit YajC